MCDDVCELRLLPPDESSTTDAFLLLDCCGDLSLNDVVEPPIIAAGLLRKAAKKDGGGGGGDGDGDDLWEWTVGGKVMLGRRVRLERPLMICRLVQEGAAAPAVVPSGTEEEKRRALNLGALRVFAILKEKLVFQSRPAMIHHVQEDSEC